uniref:Transposase n=1 Tax=Ascaris lumbricoides TaxID=6252 RepID=A0A0M3HI28_ASCLU
MDGQDLRVHRDLLDILAMTAHTGMTDQVVKRAREDHAVPKAPVITARHHDCRQATKISAPVVRNCSTMNHSLLFLALFIYSY